MSYLSKVGLMFVAVGAGLGATAPMQAQNSEPNPYRTVPGVWAPLPDGRDWGFDQLGGGFPRRRNDLGRRSLRREQLCRSRRPGRRLPVRQEG